MSAFSSPKVLVMLLGPLTAVQCAPTPVDIPCIDRFLSYSVRAAQEPRLELVACSLETELAIGDPVVAFVAIANRGAEPVFIDGLLEPVYTGAGLSAEVVGPDGEEMQPLSIIDAVMDERYRRFFLPGRGAFVKLVRLDCRSTDYLPWETDEDATGCFDPYFDFRDVGIYEITLVFESGLEVIGCDTNCAWRGRLRANEFEIEVSGE